MRCILLKADESKEIGELFVINDERAKHLIKVVRIQKDEEVLLLDGCGTKYFASVISVDKKNVELKVLDKSYQTRESHIDLFLGTPKKDAFEEIVRKSVELGISKVFPLETTYSQRFDLKKDRFDRIQESAIIQSNNPYRLAIAEQNKFEVGLELLAEYDHVFYFSSMTSSAPKVIDGIKKIAIIIGPEGGFSREEEECLMTLSKLSLIHLDMPIMRAPTALCAAAGFVHSQLTL